MKRSTERMLKTLTIGTVLLVIGGLLLGYEGNNYIGALFGAILCFAGMITNTCAVGIKYKCASVEPIDPVVLDANPLPLDCPAPPCCFEEAIQEEHHAPEAHNNDEPYCGL